MLLQEEVIGQLKEVSAPIIGDITTIIATIITETIQTGQKNTEMRILIHSIINHLYN
jgi:hypothetical protein